MSKVICKIGPSTPHVDQENISSVSFGSSPKTTIKYSTDGSVVFYDRNPFYVTLTDPDVVPSVINLIGYYNETQDEKYLVMANENIQTAIRAYVSYELFEDFSESMIQALKNSKSIGRRVANRSVDRTV